MPAAAASPAPPPLPCHLLLASNLLPVARPPQVLSQLAEEAGVELPQPERRELESLRAGQPSGPELHATAMLVDPADLGPREELRVG
jgi:hypothetical protein